METYIIGVKREARDKVPPDWLETLRGIEGLDVVGTANSTRIQVRATAGAIERVRQYCGTYCHVEAAFEHTALTTQNRNPPQFTAPD
jgi:hypothetical protein